MTYRSLRLPLVVAFTLLLTPTLAFAGSPDVQNISRQDKQKPLYQKVNDSLIKLENTARQRWGFTVSRYENEEGNVHARVEQFEPHPTLEKRWQLLSIDNQKPTEQQRKNYLKKKLTAYQHDEEQGLSVFPLRDMIVLNSLALASESDTHLQINFGVYIDKLGPKVSSRLQGVMDYNKSDGFIEQLIITNHVDFTPVFASKITDLKMTFQFVNIDGNILPAQRTMGMKGSFAWLSKIDEVSTETYSDYHKLQ